MTRLDGCRFSGFRLGFGSGEFGLLARFSTRVRCLLLPVPWTLILRP